MRLMKLIALGLVVSCSPGSAMALDPAAEPAAVLGQCMTAKSTGDDRINLARWFLTAIGSAPQLKSVVTVTPEAKETQDRAVAALFTRLLTVACLDEAKAVAASSGSAGFRVAGEALGRIAMRELLSNPEAEASMGRFADYVVQGDFDKLTPKKP